MSTIDTALAYALAILAITAVTYLLKRILKLLDLYEPLREFLRFGEVEMAGEIELLEKWESTKEQS